MIDVRFPKLYVWQQELFDGVTTDDKGRFHICKSRRQCGKTVTAASILLYFAFKGRSIGTCLEPTLGQSRRVFKQIISAIGGTDSPVLKSANATLLEIEFINGSQIIFKSAEQGDALRGITVKRSVLVLDEAAFIPSSVFEIIYPAVDALGCPVVMISTPQFEDGEFYSKFMLGLSGDEFTRSYDWAKYDTSALLPPEKLEYYRRTMSPMRFKTDYLSEFLTDKSFVFGDFTLCYGYSTKPPKVCGIDWATGKNEKDDYSCLVLMDEDKSVCDIKYFKVIDPMDLVDRIAQIINTTPSLSSVIVEENSLGEVYRSALKRKMNRPGILKSFLTTNDSKRRIIEQLIKAFSENDIKIPEDEKLKEQLQHYQIEETSGGRITYNSASGFNDDAVMALAIAYDALTKNNNKTFRIGFA
jgi:hypothetical protein